MQLIRKSPQKGPVSCSSFKKKSKRNPQTTLVVDLYMTFSNQQSSSTIDNFKDWKKVQL